MKKLFLIISLAAFGCSLSLQAAPVSSSRALEIAKRIFAAAPATKAGTGEISLFWDGEFDAVATKAASQPAFYVFTRDGGGFVIIAGDDNVQPILGISETGRFATEGMPENVKWWMEHLKKYVRATRSQSPEIRSQWANLVDTRSAIPQDLISDEYVGSRTVEWSQNAPFNSKAPTVPGQADQSVTGCLPLAMAEILTWFGQPTQGTGELEGYTYGYYADDNTGPWGYSITGYTLTTEYDWTTLKSLSTVAACQGASDAVKDNLAQLIYDCGVMLGAQFNSGAHGGTSASDSRVVQAFGEHMGYNKAARVVSASEYSSRSWTELLKAQVANHPLLYCGEAPASNGGNDASHAYVLDGYAKSNGEDVFHFNFGWGEYCNGYYSAFTQPTDAGYDFNTNLRALIDFYPAPGSEYPIILEASYINDSYPGVRVEKASPGYIIYYSIANRGYTAVAGEIKFSVLKRDGTEQDIDNSNRDLQVNVNSTSYARFGYRTINNISFGDKVVCYYKVGDDWIKLEGPVGLAISEWPLTPAAFIATESSYQVGDYFTFKLKNNDYLYAGSLWTITDPDGEVAESLLQSEREFQLTKAGTYEIKVDVLASEDSTEIIETIVTHITVQ